MSALSVEDGEALKVDITLRIKMIARFIIATPLLVIFFTALIRGEVDNRPANITTNYTELELTCVINNRNLTGDECLESLSKFGKILGWIVTGFLLIIFICCCGCWCCICKVIHGKKNQSQGGQVLSRPQYPVVNTVA